MSGAGSKIPEVKANAASKFYISVVFSIYIFATISMVLINKIVLKGAAFPISFLWGQMALATVVLQIIQLSGVFKRPSFKLSVLKKLIPLISINVVGLGLNMLCLQFADAMVFQIARSLIIPMTIGLTVSVMRERVSWQIIACCIIITAGFSAGMLGEHDLKVSKKGIIFGVLSSLSTAMHVIVIKQAYGRIEEKSPFDMIYYNNVLSTLILLPVVGFEAKDLVSAIKSGDQSLKTLLYGTLIAGAMGLLVNFVSFLQIKITSPITHTVASAARGVLQILACNLVLKEKINVPRGVGVGVTLTGSVLYSICKNYETKKSNYKIVPEPQAK